MVCWLLFEFRCFKCEKQIPHRSVKTLQDVHAVVLKKIKEGAENAVIAVNTEPITYNGTILLVPLPSELPRVRVIII